VRHRLVRAAPAAGLSLILLIDGAQRAKSWPLPQLALLDESAHLATAALVLGAASRAVGRPVWPWVLIGSVAIDIDHLPGYLGVNGFAAYGGRPLSHSLAAVLALAMLGGVARPALRQPLVGLAGGVTLHLARDLATGPGAPLLWPLIPGNVRLPYPVYVALLVVSTVGCMLRGRVAFPGATGRDGGR
jgi:inner membrane protein